MTWTVPEATRNDNRVGSEGPSCGGPSLRTMARGGSPHKPMVCGRKRPTEPPNGNASATLIAPTASCRRIMNAITLVKTVPPCPRQPESLEEPTSAVARTGKLAIESPLSEAQQATGVPSC